MVRLEGKLTIVLQSAHGLKDDDGTFAAAVVSVLELGFVSCLFCVWNVTSEVVRPVETNVGVDSRAKV